MQAHLTRGSLVNAVSLQRPCLDFKKINKKVFSRKDAAYHRKVTLAAKDFISFVESGKDVYACMDAGRAKRTAEK